MVFGIIAGAVAGFSGGFMVYHRYMEPKIKPALTYDYIDVEADSKDEFRAEWNVDAKDEETKRVLSRSPFWCTWPDYDRVLWLNSMIRVLWEKNCLATDKLVRQIVVDGLPEWQKLTADATKGAVLLQDVKIENLTLGDSPFRFSGFKLYDTPHDEIIMECPLQWGSAADVRVSATIASGPVKLYVPIQLKNMQLSGLARIMLKPLVEEFPVIGAVSISLVNDPVVDMELYVGDGQDIMGLPLMKIVLQQVLKMVLGKMMVYPNSFDCPLMENSGLPPPIQGMLLVKVVRAAGLPSSLYDKIDPYVEIEVRKGRSLKTEVIDNEANPVWEDAELRFVIDDPIKQNIKIRVKDSDIFLDQTVGVAELPMKDAPFVLRPGKKFHYQVGLQMLKQQKKNRPPQDEGGEQKTITGEDGVQREVSEAALTAMEAHKKYVERYALMDDVDEPSMSDASATIEEPDTPTSPSGDHEGKKKHHMRDHFRRKDKSVTMPEDTVIIPGSDHKARGQVFLHVTYIPFSQKKTGTLTPSASFARRERITTISNVTDSDRGVVTATLIRCLNLPDGVDPYVVITLHDPLQHRSERVKSTVKLNESNPRWDMKFDFVGISAAARIILQVYDKSVSGILPNIVASALTAVQKLVTKPQKKKLGWLEIPLAEVATNGFLKEAWNLRDAPKGLTELKFEWHPVYLEDNSVLQGHATSMPARHGQSGSRLADE